MEQVTSARAKVDMYFGKVFLKLVDNLDLDYDCQAPVTEQSLTVECRINCMG